MKLYNSADVKFDSQYREILSAFDRFGLMPFRVAESPLFLDSSLTNKLVKAGNEIIDLICSERMLALSRKAVPKDRLVPGNEGLPRFILLDFAVKGEKGDYAPQLIELQGFPSLYCYQDRLAQVFRKVLGVSNDYSWLFSGINQKDFYSLLRSNILGLCAPSEVILLDVDPPKQKTYIDFLLTEELLGIEIVNLSDVKRHGNQIFYLRNGKKTRIRRIYNRVIQEEIMRTAAADFHLVEPVDVEWASHPNWFFRISKFLLPHIRSPYVPETHFLKDVVPGQLDLARFVLKPLFSFGGKGVNLNPTEAAIAEIPDTENFILQKKLNYARVEVPFEGKASEGISAEIRLMYLWDEVRNQPLLTGNLCRFSQLGNPETSPIGNRFTGSSVAFF